MSAPRWKRVRPTSLRHAMELCLEHGRVERNLSVERAADLMGITSRWTLYKWLESGKLPTNMVLPFEHVCGIDYITRYLANAHHKLVIDIPRGQRASDTELAELHQACADCIAALVRCYQAGADESTAVEGIDTLLGRLVWHRENLAKLAQPELDLDGGEA